MKFKLNHIALPSHDLDLAENFYTNILKMPFLEYKWYNDKNKRAIWYQCHSFILMIESSNKPIFQNENSVLAFTIKEEDRLKLTEALSRAQITICKQTDYTLYFRDPSGHMLAFSHFK